MTRSSRIVRNLTALAAALALLCTACGSGSPPPRLVTSRYETATGHRIVRDCGFSVPLPGQAHRSLWLFCDTLVTGRHGQEVGYPILGAGTAAEGPYVAGRGPGALTELATPAAGPPIADAPGTPGVAGDGLLPARAAPQPFLPVPANLTLPASTVPCSTGSRHLPGPVGDRGRPRARLVRARADQLHRLLRVGRRQVHPGGVRPGRLRSGGQRARPACPGVHDAARAAAAPAAGVRLAGLSRRLPVPVRLVRAGLLPRRGLPGQDACRGRGVGQRVHVPVLDRARAGRPTRLARHRCPAPGNPWGCRPPTTRPTGTGWS